MRTRTLRRPSWAVMIAIVFTGLAGCASESAQTGTGTTDFADVFELSADLNGTVGLQYGGSSEGLVFRVKGSDRNTAYFWTVAGDPPPGVIKYPPENTELGTVGVYETIGNSFSLRGVPSACVQRSLTIQVHSADHTKVIVAATPIRIVINGSAEACGPPTITTASALFIVDTPAARTLEVTGGAQPYLWSVIGSIGISGLNLDPNTGVLSGTPGVEITRDIRVEVRDSAGRSDSRTVTIIVKRYRLEDFTGTWSGKVKSGYFQQPDGSFRDITDQRLSLLITGPEAPTPTRNYATDPITGGTLGSLVLDPVPAGLSLEPSLAGYSGLFNGQINQLKWHFTCDPDINNPNDLICSGHHFAGAQYDTQARLTRVSTAQQDSTPPIVASSNPANGATGATAFPVSITFNEPMSGSAAVSLASGNGIVGAVTFSDLTTAVIPLSGLNSNTTYTLVLNPSGQTGFMDLAGNPLAERTISFATGVLDTATLTVNKGGDGNGRVIIDPVGIVCDESNATCPVDLSRGTSVTLTAVPSAGSTFGGWSGPCSGTGICPVTLDTDKLVTATFNTIPRYVLTVNVQGAGSVTSNPPGLDCTSPNQCSGTFLSGTAVTLTAQPDPGYTFTGWSACSNTAYCAVVMNADRTVTATFTVQQYALTVSTSGSGSVSSDPAGIACGSTCTARFDYGTAVTLTAVPATGYTFAGWSGACSGLATQCALSVDSAKSVTATFTLASYSLSVSKTGTGNGSISSSPPGINCGSTCSASFTYETVVTLTATAAADSVFSGWGGACTGNGTTCTVTRDALESVTATFTLRTVTLTVSKNGSGTVTSSPSGITCGSTCSAEFVFGSNVTLTATPASGYTFGGWSGACSGGGSCMVTMDEAKSVTATFDAIPTYTLTITRAGAGSGTVTSSPAGINCGSVCAASFSNGTLVTLTASSSAGSVFTGWTGAGCSGTGACTVTLSGDTSVTATFDPQPTYQLSVTIGGTGSGTVVSTPSGINCTASCSSNFAQGTSVTLSATPATGSTFAGWNGACTDAGPCVVSMSSAQSVTALFNLQSYSLTIVKNGAGTGTVISSPAGINCGSTCSANFNYGTTVTLTATPSSGSTFAGWSGAGCSGTDICRVTITAATNVTATFTVPSYTLTLSTTGVGSGVVTSNPSGINCGSTCSAIFPQGTSVTLTATPAAGSAFAGWSGDCTGSANPCPLTMDAAKSVTATFTTQTYTLTVAKNGTGSGTVTSSPAGIDCGGTCAVDFGSGVTVTLTAVPDSGSVFAGWSGAGCSGTGPCTVTMNPSQTVTATFNAQSGVIAYPQTFTFAKRQPTSVLYRVQNAITLTGSSPNPGPLTFRITRFPVHQDPLLSMNLIQDRTYQFVDPITGVRTQAVATTSSTVNMTTGDVSGAPIVVYTPNICHDIFSQDTFEFVAIDSLGNVSAPATVTMNSSDNTCNHG